MNTGTLTVIPDVHGRSFWKEAVKDINEVPAVFLGDYLDPYPEEHISRADALSVFLSIMELKKAYPGKVTLLLGNHDLQYLLSTMGSTRTDKKRLPFIQALLSVNLDLFDIALDLKTVEHRYLFTHAGVLAGWLGMNGRLFDKSSREPVGTTMNRLFHNNGTHNRFMASLCDKTACRGGCYPYGSPVWADVTEHDPTRAQLDGIYQVFAHTWMERELITPHWACLDCGAAFTLDLSSGTIVRIETET